MTMRRACVLLCVLVMSVEAQDRHDWQSLARLRAGDTIRVSLKTGAPIQSDFRNWTPAQVTAGAVTTARENVTRIERYREGRGRARKAALGAVIGFGGGFATGAAAGGCPQGRSGCISRAALGGGFGFLGAVAGAVIGALLPTHTTELIYAAR